MILTAGVDVSHHQGRIDWDRVARYHPPGGHGPIRFSIMKATEGRDYTDRTYRPHREAALRRGIIPGGYHLLRPDTPGDADLEAEHYLRVVGTSARERDGDLGPLLDVEKHWLDEATPRQAVNEIMTWAEVVRRELGRRPILYVSARGIQSLIDRADPEVVQPLGALPLWIVWHKRGAVVPRLPITHSDWVLWQWTSDEGDERAAGVQSSGLDLDWFRGSVEQLGLWRLGIQPLP